MFIRAFDLGFAEVLPLLLAVLVLAQADLETSYVEEAINSLPADHSFRGSLLENLVEGAIWVHFHGYWREG